MRELELTNGYVALVDEVDYPYLSQFKWHARQDDTRFYVTRYVSVKQGGPAKIAMHRELLAPQQGQWIDHIDGNGLNNTRGNLRLCTLSQNQANRGPQKNNTSGYKGVHWHSRAQRWQAMIRHKGKRKSLGMYVDVIDAARAYDNAAIGLFGEFARLNIPDRGA